jgi:hypothetical protein
MSAVASATLTAEVPAMIRVALHGSSDQNRKLQITLENGNESTSTVNSTTLTSVETNKACGCASRGDDPNIM